MEIQQLRHFLAIVELGSYARASERLNITQPGLSRSIKALEDSLRLELFERVSRGVRLTNAGRMLVPHARSILNERDRAIADAQAFGALKLGQATVGISTVFNYIVTPDVIASVRGSDMGIDLHIISGPYESMSERLELGEMDFAFLLFGPERRRALDYEPVMSIESRIFASEGHPLHAVANPSAEQLLDYDWILSDNPGLRAVFGDFFAHHGLLPPPVSIAPSELGLLLMAMKGTNLLTLLPSGFADLPFAARPLEVEGLHRPSLATAGLVMRRGSSASPAATALSQMFRAAATRYDQAALGA